MTLPTVTDFSDASIVHQDTGVRTTLGSLWKEKPVVLLFLRRLGCAICRAQAKELDAFRPTIEAHGAKVIALSFETQGEGSDSDRSFLPGNYWTGDIYSIDKEVQSKLFGRKGIWNGFFGLTEITKEVRDKVKALEITGNQKGDGFQLGGQFVVDPRGHVVFEHRQKKQGDDAELNDLEDAVMQALECCPQSSGTDSP